MSGTLAQVEKRLEAFAADYDARRITAEIAVKLHQREQVREMLSLLSARPSWEDGTLVLQFQSKFGAQLLRPLYRTIAAVVHEWGVDEVILTWKTAEHEGFRIIATMGAGDSIFDIPPPLDLDASITEAMRIGDLIRGAENPIGAVLLDSDWQIWGNQALSVMCQKPLEELVRTNVRANWVDRRARSDDGLASIKHRLTHGEPDFVLPYRTKMSGDSAIKHDFESRFRLMLGGRLRVTEIYSYTPVT